MPVGEKQVKPIGGKSSKNSFFHMLPLFTLTNKKENISLIWIYNHGGNLTWFNSSKGSFPTCNTSHNFSTLSSFTWLASHTHTLTHTHARDCSSFIYHNRHQCLISWNLIFLFKMFGTWKVSSPKKLQMIETKCNNIFRTMNSKEINILSSVWCWKKCTGYWCPIW